MTVPPTATCGRPQTPNNHNAAYEITKSQHCVHRQALFKAVVAALGCLPSCFVCSDPRKSRLRGTPHATLNPNLDFEDLERRYNSSAPSFVVIDDLFEPQTLEDLYEMVRGWHEYCYQSFANCYQPLILRTHPRRMPPVIQ